MLNTTYKVIPTKPQRKNRAVRGGAMESYEKSWHKHYYVVEKILWQSQAAEEDDLIRVEKIDKKSNTATLQPLLQNKYVVSLNELKRDYVKI